RWLCGRRRPLTVLAYCSGPTSTGGLGSGGSCGAGSAGGANGPLPSPITPLMLALMTPGGAGSLAKFAHALGLVGWNASAPPTVDPTGVAGSLVENSGAPVVGSVSVVTCTTVPASPTAASAPWVLYAITV